MALLEEQVVEQEELRRRVQTLAAQVAELRREIVAAGDEEGVTTDYTDFTDFPESVKSV
jgi:hypothetical protein